MNEYKNKEEIEILQCRREYHADCIRRWLHEKNVGSPCTNQQHWLLNKSENKFILPACTILSYFPADILYYIFMNNTR